MAISLALGAGLTALSYWGLLGQFEAVRMERDRLEGRAFVLGSRVRLMANELGAERKRETRMSRALESERARVARFDKRAADLQRRVAAISDSVARVEAALGSPDAIATRASKWAGDLSDPAQALESLFGPIAYADTRAIRAIQTLEKRADQEARIPSGWPAQGPITSTFGFRFGPKTGKLERHTGWDIAAPQGTPAQVTAAGTVIAAGFSDAGYGLHVVVDHGNGLKTLYGHLSEIEVQAGDEIALGVVVGLVGSTGNSTGPHLHYEVRLEDVAVDPGPFLDRQRPPTPLLGPSVAPLGTGLPPSRPHDP